MSFAQYHVNETARAARAAHARMMRGDGANLYVYYRELRFEAFPEGGVPSGEGWKLAFPEPCPQDKDVDGLIAWFAMRTERVPYLPSK